MYIYNSGDEGLQEDAADAVPGEFVKIYIYVHSV